jgi:hypothetical protein
MYADEPPLPDPRALPAPASPLRKSVRGGSGSDSERRAGEGGSDRGDRARSSNDAPDPSRRAAPPCRAASPASPASTRPAARAAAPLAGRGGVDAAPASPAAPPGPSSSCRCTCPTHSDTELRAPVGAAGCGTFTRRAGATGSAPPGARSCRPPPTASPSIPAVSPAGAESGFRRAVAAHVPCTCARSSLANPKQTLLALGTCATHPAAAPPAEPTGTGASARAGRADLCRGAEERFGKGRREGGEARGALKKLALDRRVPRAP